MGRRAVSFLLVSSLLALASFAQSPASRVVDLTASDGIHLKATYFPAAKSGPGVLLLHQCNRQRKVWDDLATRMAAAGIHVLTLDLRGFGESGGTPNDKLTPQEAQTEGQKWPSDIDIAFHYLQSQPGVKRDVMGVGGASCGVNNAIQTARRHPKEIKSMVLLSGTTNLAGRQFIRKAGKLPLLVGFADDDEFKPTIDAIQWIFSLSSDPGKQIVHYATGGHGADMFRVHPELRSKITDWYVTTLIKTPGSAPPSKTAWSVPPTVQILNLIDEPGGAAQAGQKLAEARKHDPKAALFSEDIVNLLGYEHMQAGDIKGGIEILKLNAQAFPNSPNVYDSLSDAYLADGQKDLARQNAKKTLELLAADTTYPEDQRKAIRDNAQQKLKQLGDQ